MNYFVKKLFLFTNGLLLGSTYSRTVEQLKDVSENSFETTFYNSCSNNLYKYLFILFEVVNWARIYFKF